MNVVVTGGAGFGFGVTRAAPALAFTETGAETAP